MRAFVISLKDSLKRRDNIIKYLNAYNLDFEFVDAVTVRYVKKNIKKVYNRKLTNRNYSRDLSRYEIACSLSHIKVYSLMLELDIEAAIILEDDVIPNSYPVSGIEFITSKIRDGTLERGIRIGISISSEAGEFVNPIRPSIFKDFEILQSDGWGSFAYVITKDQAKEISEKNFPVQFVADSPLRELLCISPPLFNHDFNSETTMPDRNKYTSKSDSIYRLFFRIFRRIWREITKPMKSIRKGKKF